MNSFLKDKQTFNNWNTVLGGPGHYVLADLK